jgi:hypothetical protein
LLHTNGIYIKVEDSKLPHLEPAWYGDKIWTLRTVDQEYLESSEMWCWRRLEKIVWTDCSRNEVVLHSVEKDINILHTINRRKVNWIGHILRRNCLRIHVIKEKLEGRKEVTVRRGRRSTQLLDDLKKKTGYWKLKKAVLHRILLGTCCGREYGPVIRQRVL